MMRYCGVALTSSRALRAATTAAATVAFPSAQQQHHHHHRYLPLSIPDTVPYAAVAAAAAAATNAVAASFASALRTPTRLYGTSHRGRSNGINADDDLDEDIFVKKPKSAFAEEKGYASRHRDDDDEEADGGDDFYDSERERVGISGEEEGESAAGDEGGNGATARGSVKVQTSPSMRTVYPPSGIDLPESSFLKCLEKEMEDEKLRLDKEEGAPPPPQGWELHHVNGSSVFYGRRLWMPPATSPTFPLSGPDHGKSTGTSVGGSSDKRERGLEKHFIRVQLTTRDAALDPECDVRGEHFPFSFFVQRMPLSEKSGNNRNNNNSSNGMGDSYDAVARIHAPTFDEAEELSMYENSVEVRLDVVDGELVVDAVVYHGERELLSQVNRQKLKPTLKSGAMRRNSPDDDDMSEEDERMNPFCNAKTHRNTSSSSASDGSGGGGGGGGAESSTKGAKVVAYNNVFGGYPGPNLDEAEEEILDGIQSWLAERQIDDRFGEFVGQHSVWVEQMEYEAWLQQLHDYVAA